MVISLRVRAWSITLGLLTVTLLAIATVVQTGAPLPVVSVALSAFGGIAYASYRSGGRYAFDHGHARPFEPGELPEVHQTVLEVCESATRPIPTVVLMEMDAPGAVVGYDDGAPIVALDPLLPQVVGREGVGALFAHELGHLGTDLHTDALRAYLPQILGFCVFWHLFLGGRGPAVAGIGSLLFGAFAFAEDRRIRVVRYILGLGIEPLALAVSRYANRLEEYQADAYAACVVDPETLAEALYRVAAVATGENIEDIAGPIPWNEDRSLRFALFATHPSIENRVARLGCEIPLWARPYHPSTNKKQQLKYVSDTQSVGDGIADKKPELESSR
ncbi:Zn-dependent protease with chaperone function [Haladaptatus litoreus]|uniref:Zn-dependent protease with chaperone function n=1 Tax=Haladaptatus litoreus TaxID=553468 RepID=A0A1N7FEF0_9EURY|nr:M48 family metalloprotease [Haladaptatus litoreus]SIR98660.1 Zn-dependent protease with chaperone function [Haladaptatus litoreus]